jgi:DNA-binding CsgD family transcriptional regulator
MRFKINNYIFSVENGAFEDDKLPQEVRDALNVLIKHGHILPPSPKKQESAKKAREVLQRRTREKINYAIEVLKTEKRGITPYAVAKIAGVSYNTARKYLTNFLSKSQQKDLLCNL